MVQDYTYPCLSEMSNPELQELSHRLLHRLVPESSVKELFTFEDQQTMDDDKRQELHFDALLRMNAIALSEIPALFASADNPEQNIERMTRLILWHFYAVSFRLQNAISLKTHCDQVEALLNNRPKEAYQWVNSLTRLLQDYAELAKG
ncbi:exoribonuclease R [Vibrio sp. AK197]